MLDITLKSERQFETRMVGSLSPVFASGCSAHPGQAQNSTSSPPSRTSQESFAQLSASAVPPRALWQPCSRAERIPAEPHPLPGCASVTCSALGHSAALDSCALRFCLIFPGVLRRRADPNCPVLHWRKGTMISALPQLRSLKTRTSSAGYHADFCLFIHIFEHGGLNHVP